MDMNQMQDEGEGKTGTCVKVYIAEDGSYSVGKTENEPIPEDAQPAASLEEAFQMAQDLAAAPPEGDEDAAMQSAQAGYNRKAQGSMSAPNPAGVFGE
jgi:hypothetical protein